MNQAEHAVAEKLINTLATSENVDEPIKAFFPEPASSDGKQKVMLVHEETGAAYRLDLPRGTYAVVVNDDKSSIVMVTVG